MGRFFINKDYQLSILDSTDPAQVLAAAIDYPPAQTLYIVASKSGGTAEVMAAFEYFWELSGQDGSRFIAITDPGTSLEKLAVEHGFRRVFNADPSVGGRYSALTHFGLVPAALIGVDLAQLLDRAAQMRQACGGMDRGRSVVCRNPGIVLGAILGQSALGGRDKLTILADLPLESFGSWMEQLIAESTGKQDMGIVPIDLEPLGEPAIYGNDRLFVYLRQTGEHDLAASGLRAAGFPVLEFPMPDAYSLGSEFFRWELATAVACHILGVNAFDQPDVQDAKDRTKAKIAEFQDRGNLPEKDLVALEDAGAALKALLAAAKQGDYIAINAYLPRNDEMLQALTALRSHLRDQTQCATTLGFGPRFQHSTGQLHKGGPDSGLFIQIVADPGEDVKIPAQGMSFGTLERAQALGDYEALSARGRGALRLHLPDAATVRELASLTQPAGR
jgi:transaldolase/glucose-6-phosphate isomerase